jgi:phage protein D
MALDETAYLMGMAPEFAVFVNDIEMPPNITQFVTSVEYENLDQAVDKITLELMNPDFTLTNRKFLLPGNVIMLYGGYGKVEDSGKQKVLQRGQLEFLAAGIVTHVRQNFPDGDMPTISVTALSKDYFMNQRRPDLDQEDSSNPRQQDRSEKVDSGEKKHSWGMVDYSDAVKEIANRYGFFTTDDEGKSTIETSGVKENLYQIQGMTDYEFVVGLANLLGWYFWVSANKEGRWLLHFKSPKSVLKSQKKVYTLRYNDGDNSTLLTFEPEMLINDIFTKVSAETLLPNGRILKKAIVFDQTQQWSPVSTRFDQTVEGPIQKPSDVKLYMNDFAISIPDVTGIREEADLERFMKTWVERHQDSFMLGSGTCVGLELMRARQIHRLENLGTLYDGEWIFDMVRHKFSSSEGYSCEFHARKVDKSRG